MGVNGEIRKMNESEKIREYFSGCGGSGGKSRLD
jgi:hypothetical protein